MKNIARWVSYWLQKLFVIRCPYCNHLLPSTTHLRKCSERYKQALKYRRRQRDMQLIAQAATKSIESELVRTSKEKRK